MDKARKVWHLLLNGNWDGARRLYARFKLKSDSTSASWECLKRLMREDLGNRQKLIPVLEEQIRTSNLYVEPLVLLADLYVEFDRMEEACHAIECANLIDGQFPGLQNRLGF